MDEPISSSEKFHPNPDGTALDEIYVTKGKGLTEIAISDLTEKLSRDENDLKSRLQLLGCFWRFQDQPDQANKFKVHALWMINNRPEDEVCGTAILLFSKKYRHLLRDVKKAWREAIKRNPENAKILGNAGYSLSLLAPKEAAKYLEKSVLLDDTNRRNTRVLKSLHENVSEAE